MGRPEERKNNVGLKKSETRICVSFSNASYERKTRKEKYEKRLENQINSFLACVSIRQEKNLQKIKKCTKKIAKYFTEKKILRQLGTTMFKKSKKKIQHPPSLNIYETLVLKRSKKRTSKLSEKLISLYIQTVKVK